MAPPILVTGAHRSGTTWVGRMLAASPRMTYIHEPFNLLVNDRLWSVDVDHWFAYLTEANVEPHRRALMRLGRLAYTPLDVIRRARTTASRRQQYRYLKDFVRCVRHRLRDKRALIKDPIALLSAEWLAAAWSAQVVVMVRHPAAFAGSLKVKDWTFDFANLLEQPLLMEGPLQPFQDEIQRFTHEEHDIVDQAALLWTVLYDVVDQLRARHPAWIVIKHETIARAPEPAFRKLYATLDLPFTEAVRATIAQHSTAQRGTGIRRDSAAVIDNWKHRLTPEEIERVRWRTEPVASRFYSIE